MAKRQNNNIRMGKIQKNDVTEEAQEKQIITSNVRDIKTSPIEVKELTKQTKKTVVPTQEQISERAKVIWKQRGCKSGEDQRNWFEAEHQLQEELSRT
jgi:predicted CoA-binding protein